MAEASELLWEDEELRLVRLAAPDGTSRELWLRPVSAKPLGATLERIEREHQLSSALGAEWAVRSTSLLHRDGRPLLVFEDPGGVLLESRTGRAWPVPDFLRLSLALCSALRQLHARGIVHGDIRPRNILHDVASGRAWLCGFGAARRLGREQRALSPLPELVGSFIHVAPEQTGRLNRSVDFRSDLYALGVTLYELLGGKLPFSAVTASEWVQSHIARAPAPLPEQVPVALAAIVARLLSKAPEDRYPSARSLEADLAHCDAAWRSLGRIDAFTLGSRDTEGALALPRKLYGRQEDSARLLGLLGRVVDSGNAEVVVVSGPSGIGKSALVRELEGAAPSAGAWFATGKFDQYKRNTPYAPLAEALDQLVRRVLGQPDAEVAHVRDGLREAVGASGQLLVDLVPSAALLLGPQPPIVAISNDDARNRFRGVLERVVAVFAREARPLLLFIDDLQWLDTATLDLLVHLTTRAELPHTLFVLACRDDPADAPLERALAQLRDNPKTCFISPAPLSVGGVGALLEDLLHTSAESVSGLAALVWEKTNGNPFFTTHFVAELAEDALLHLDEGTGTWSWDLGAIERRGFTENVVALLSGKLLRLPEETLEVLKRLACLGHGATFATLGLVCREVTSDLAVAIGPALRAGLVRTGPSGYELVHDRVQEAALSTLTLAERDALHLAIGRLLWSASGMPEPTDAIFEVVDQFRRAARLLTDPDERRTVAALNRAAAARAQESAAYDVAASCLAAALALLPDDVWATDYATKFELELRHAECSLLTGSRDVDAELVALSERARGPIDSAAVTCLRAGRYVADSRLDQAIAVCVSYLASAGQHVRPQPGDEDVNEEYRRLRAALDRLPVSALSELPAATGAEWLALMSVFEALLPAAAFSDRNMFDWAAFRVVNLSIEHGNCVQSAIAYSHMALSLPTRFADREMAFQFGEVARALVERPGFERYNVRVLVVLAYHVMPWTAPLSEALAQMRRTKHDAFEQGDFTYVGFAGVHVVQLGVAAASPLDEVLADARRELSFARKAGFAFLADCHVSLVALLQALLGNEPPPEPGDGPDQHVPAVPIATCWHWLRRMQACILFGNVGEALRSKREAEALISTSQTHYDFAEFTFFGGLAEALGGDLERARAHRARMATWAGGPAATFAARASLLDAEIAQREGRALDAQQHFERAVKQAGDGGLLHDEALANERAARFHEVMGLDTAARAYHAAARYSYARWGAHGKVDQLDARRRGQSRDASLLAGQIGNLDLTTVVEMSRAISSEIELDRIIERLVALALDHAGATRGLLVLAGPGGLRIEAEARAGAEPRVRLGRSAVAASSLPVSILRYVARTLDTVIIDDATLPGRFATDEYLKGGNVRAVFCLPVVKQATLVGVLYLENALTPSAFTPDRVEVLQLLGSQAAVSLENAQLFTSLRRAELDLTEAQRLSQTGSFRWHVGSAELELSDEAQRIYGFAAGSRVSAEDYLGRIHPDDRERVREEMHEQLLREAGWRSEHRLQLPGGTLKHVRMLAHAAAVNGDVVSEILGAVVDVTAQKRAEEAEGLELAKEAAEAANRAKDEFLANVSHEIRTPMNAILGMTELVLDSAQSDEHRQWLGTAKSAAESLLTIIDELLDFSKIEAGKAELTLGPLALRAELEEVLRALTLRAERQGIALRSEIDPAAPERLLGDTGKLRQILINLIGNAIKFTDRGGVVLRVDALPELEGRAGFAGLRFSVEDTGIGISPEKHALIFKAFTQADSSTTRVYGGTGLGLTIAARLAKLMGSEIVIESQLGAGSRFSFELLLARQVSAVEGPLESGVRPVMAREAARLPLRILVAEDNDFNGLLMTALLSKRRHVVEVVTRGTDALARLAGAEFDLMLLDLQMPDLDGFEVIRRVRERERERTGEGGRRLPVIACTARSRREDLERCLAAGMDDFLAKPIRSEALWAAIDRVVSRRPGGGLDGELLDAEALLAACGGDAGILVSLCGALRRHLPLQMARAMGHAARGDVLGLREAAHEIFGTVAAVSARAGLLAARIEEEAIACDLDAARDSVIELQGVVERVLSRIEGVSIEELLGMSARRLVVGGGFGGGA